MSEVESTAGNGAPPVIVIGNLVCCTLLAMGILGMLQTKLEETQTLVVFTVHPVTAVAWFVLGVVGVAMCTRPRGARLYLLGAGALLVLWGLLCLVLDGTPSDVFARDAPLVALLLVLGALALAVALVRPAARAERVPG